MGKFVEDTSQQIHTALYCTVCVVEFGFLLRSCFYFHSVSVHCRALHSSHMHRIRPKQEHGSERDGNTWWYWTWLSYSLVHQIEERESVGGKPWRCMVLVSLTRWHNSMRLCFSADVRPFVHSSFHFWLLSLSDQNIESCRINCVTIGMSIHNKWFAKDATSNRNMLCIYLFSLSLTTKWPLGNSIITTALSALRVWDGP